MLFFFITGPKCSLSTLLIASEKESNYEESLLYLAKFSVFDFLFFCFNYLDGDN